MTKKNSHHLVWDLYSSKMRTLIAEHTHAKKNDGTRFLEEKLGMTYSLDLNYDESLEQVTDVYYLLSGPTFMIAFLEGLCEIVLERKASKLGFIRAGDVLEKVELYEIAEIYSDRDVADYVKFISPYVGHLIDSYLTVVEGVVPKKFTTPEGLSNFSVDGDGVENFFEFPKEAKISLLEEVMDKDIRPFVALDDGGVKIKDITRNGVVLIEYEGNCTSCHAAGSTTLSAITSILKAKVHPSLEVLPFIS